MTGDRSEERKGQHHEWVCLGRCVDVSVSVRTCGKLGGFFFLMKLNWKNKT